mmetsp:Transcript_5827/g.16341  ORF Transcript_5827/g.16341 Transcript_5827/m.16341 type:complete len:474 (-) Transcript_5827:53-1474(-)
MTLPSSNHDDEEVAPKMEDVDADDSPERATNFDQLRKMKSSIRLHGPVPGDDEFDENNAPVRFVVNEWAQGTSIHGVPYVTDSIQWRLWKRATWIVLVLVSAAFMIWQCTQLITQYREFEVITDTQTMNPTTLDFPQVTLCNANPYSSALQNATGITEPKSEEELFNISTPRDDLIFQTFFNGAIVDNSESWRSTIISGFGQCWIFNTDEKVRRPGFFGGLRVYMDLQQYDYEDTTEWASVFVWVSQPGTEVNMFKSGNSAKPGKETYLSMEYTEYMRERTAPWARCEGEAPEYTQFQCRAQCINDWIRNNCECRDEQDRQDMSLGICERSGPDKECILSGYFQEDEVLEKCGCNLPPCYEQDYKLFLVEAEPANKYFARLSQAFNVTGDYARDNFVALTINFEKLQYKRLTESKGMSFSQLLGAIGGSMGFFLGISLVSIFELLGDLVGMRLLPRFFGHKNLYGVGAHYKVD